MAGDTQDIGALPTAIGTGLVGGIMNTFGQNTQMQNQQNLMQEQLSNQEQLNLQNQQIQQQNWQFTSYPNQVKEMEEAGLNVGLMYGMGGGGSSMMGGGSGGSAMGAQAPQNNASSILGMALQSETLKSEIDKNEAEAADAQASAVQKGGPQTEVLGAQKDNLNADSGLKTTQATGQELDNIYKSGNLNTALEKSQQELENLKAENVKLVADGTKSQIDAENEQKMLSCDMALKNTEAILNQHKISLTDEQRKAIGVELAQGWEKLSNAHDANKIEMNNANTKRLEFELDKIMAPAGLEVSARNATKQAISHVAGSIIMAGAIQNNKTQAAPAVGTSRWKTYTPR